MRIAHLNVYAGNRNPSRAITALLAGKPASASINEGYRIIPLLEKRTGYRVIYDKGAKDQRRGAKDVPILTRKDQPSLGTMTLFGARSSTPLKIAPDRWFTVSMFLNDSCGEIAHLNLHPHAAVQDADGRFNNTDRADKFKNQMRLLDKLIGFLDPAFNVIVSGDLNYRNKGEEQLSPYEIFARHGMHTKSVGIDAIAWKGVTLVTSGEIPKVKTGSDHEGLWAEFK